MALFEWIGPLIELLGYGVMLGGFAFGVVSPTALVVFLLVAIGIIIAVDEPLDATSCGGQENCHDSHRCMTHDLWTDLNKTIFAYLANVSLASLVVKQRAKETAVVQDRRRVATPAQDGAAPAL